VVRWAAGGNRREQYKISSILFSPTLYYDKTKFNYKDLIGGHYASLRLLVLARFNSPETKKKERKNYSSFASKLRLRV